jgi:nitrite reductase/ring-hydroxylating ferredoxin subunit
MLQAHEDLAGDPQRLCASAELLDGGAAVPFDVRYCGRVCRAIAVRFQSRAQAYLNRCTHVAIELDYLPNRVFDSSGQWLLCATHGAMYSPTSGACVGGPCRGGLVKITLSEIDGEVRWHTSPHLQPVDCPP